MGFNGLNQAQPKPILLCFPLLLVHPNQGVLVGSLGWPPALPEPPDQPLPTGTHRPPLAAFLPLLLFLFFLFLFFFLPHPNSMWLAATWLALLRPANPHQTPPMPRTRSTGELAAGSELRREPVRLLHQWKIAGATIPPCPSLQVALSFSIGIADPAEGTPGAAQSFGSTAAQPDSGVAEARPHSLSLLSLSLTGGGTYPGDGDGDDREERRLAWGF